jgi:parvulin-like peptidyl-prolyl isomerase
VHTDKLDAPERGWQTQRELGSQRWAAVAMLQVGQLTPVVRSPFGVHRLQLLEKRAEHTATLDEAKPRLLAELQQLHLYQTSRALLLKLRAKAKVQRMAPFDHPPGGLPMAGDVTLDAFEEDDD